MKIISVGEIEFTDSYILFFYPKDFTFVCPTELVKLGENYSKFKDLGYEVYAISPDSEDSHKRWQETPIEKGGIGVQEFIHVYDEKHMLIKACNVLTAADNVPWRTTIIVKDRRMRSTQLQDLPLGRNIEEILRLCEAINYTDLHGEVCPVQWNPDEKAMIPTQEGLLEYVNR